MSEREGERERRKKERRKREERKKIKQKRIVIVKRGKRSIGDSKVAANLS